MKKVCGLKYFHHPYSFPRSSPPSWAEKVDRWHQLDAYSFGLIDAYAQLQDRLEDPEFILLASPSASNDTDRAFVLSKAKSPAKMVHTLPNVRSSSLVKFMDWGGPVLCLQKDPQTLLTAIVEGLDLLDPSCRNLMIWGVVKQAPPLYEAHVFSLTYLASEEKRNNGFPYIIQRVGDDPSLTCPNDELLVEWLSKPFPRGDLTISPQITLSPNLKLPIDVSDLEQFLPHRRPMVWVNQILQIDSKGGEALIHLDPKAHYMDREEVRPSSVIEWIAQTYGYVRACQSLMSGDGLSTAKISHAYLASFKNLLFLEKFDSWIQGQKSLAVYVQTLRDLTPLKTVYGEVKTLAGKKIATGEITVYSD